MSQRIDTILDLLTEVRAATSPDATLEVIREHRNSANRRLAEEYDVTEQTVRDTYREQLRPNVDGVEAFDVLLHAWRTSDDGALEAVLLTHADATDRDRIEQFFALGHEENTPEYDERLITTSSNVGRVPAFWILKCNPTHYRLAERLADSRPTISWRVHQYRNEMRSGDTVFIWESGSDGGIRAVMELEALPREMAELESERPYNIEPDTETRWRVIGRLTNRNVNLSRAALLQEQELGSLSRVATTRNATTFRVTPEEGAILLRLVREQEESFIAEEAAQVGAAQAEGSDGIDCRTLVLRQIYRRRAQHRFRDVLRDLYGNRCMVTGCEVLAVLEAAHIRTHATADDNRPENGLLLRSDIHKLFDDDLLGIEPKELRVELHPALALGKEYADLSKEILRCSSERPSEKALEERYARFRDRLLRPV